MCFFVIIIDSVFFNICFTYLKVSATEADMSDNLICNSHPQFDLNYSVPSFHCSLNIQRKPSLLSVSLVNYKNTQYTPSMINLSASTNLFILETYIVEISNVTLRLKKYIQ